MVSVRRLPEFDAWFASVRDRMVRKRLLVRLRKLQLGNLGDYRAVGKGVLELREHFGPGWRLYCTRRGETVIVMLGGGDKATQVTDIATAKKLVETLED